MAGVDCPSCAGRYDLGQHSDADLRDHHPDRWKPSRDKAFTATIGTSAMHSESESSIGSFAST